MNRAIAIRLIALAGILIPLSARLSAQTPYREVEVRDGGVVAGVVRADGEHAPRELLPIVKDSKICGSKKTSARWIVGRSGGVANAIVYLENIAEGKARQPAARQTLSQVRCEYIPHVMIAPLGSELEIVNNDPILHNVHAYETGVTLKSIFNIAQPIKGQRTVVKAKQLSRPGILVATCDAGHPWMDAAIAVAPHPYYALTDTSGTFRIDNVPPGTYTVVVWHEGVRVLKAESEGEKVTKYIYEEPYVLRREAAVAPSQTASVEFRLTLR